jgi:hypothetical protein
MKKIFYFLFSLFLVNCNAQNSDFEEYLNHFSKLDFPFMLNVEDHGKSYEIFLELDTTGVFLHLNKTMKESIVDRYVCSGGFCNSHGGYFRYDYGAVFDYSSDFQSVIVRKQGYETNNMRDFDLGEILLITYDKEGNILSRKSISNDNDFWQSSLIITKDSISVLQIKITSEDINQDELNCDYWTTNYQITSKGEIETVIISPVSKGIVVMDKQNDFSYKLK